MPKRDGSDHLWWHGRFRGRGFKITASREEILNVLMKSNKHLSAEDIFMEIRSVHPEISLATIYRTLEILSNKLTKN